MDGLTDKIVEKYSDDLLRLFPLQKIFAIISTVLILQMAQHGEYLSAINSVMHLSIKELFVDSSPLLKASLGTLFTAMALTTATSFAQDKLAKTVSRFLIAEHTLNDLSQKIHQKSKLSKLPTEIATVLIAENSNKLKLKKANLTRISSLTELLFILAIAEAIAIIYGGNTLDFSIFLLLLACWFLLRFILIFKFIAQILPLEAHIAGIRGTPYELAYVLDNPP